MKLTRHFSRREMQCPATLKCDMNEEFMANLEALRIDFGKPMIVTSGFRSREHNERIGGAPNSQHLFGNAVDFVVTSSSDRYTLIKLAIQYGFTGIGIGKDYMHFDRRKITPVIWLSL